MNAFVLAAALLFGDPCPSEARLEIRVHVGKGRESDVVRSELRCPEDWFWRERLAVLLNYRIAIVDDLYTDRPCYQIGRGGDRIPFPRGTFLASGTFLMTMHSIAAIDHWERENGETQWIRTAWGEYETQRSEDRKPELFPPPPDGQ